MSPYTGGAIIPGEDDEWDDILFANPAGGTIPAKKNRRTGHMVLCDGTINPGYKMLIVPDDPSPIAFSESIADFRPVINRLDPKDKYDINQACVEWATIDKSNGTSLEAFLANRFGIENSCMLMPVSTFNNHLKRAHAQGLIDKGANGRWKPITGT